MAEGRATTTRDLRMLLYTKDGSWKMSHLNKWLVRAAILGGTAAVLAAGLFYLLLTRPVAVASVLEQLF